MSELLTVVISYNRPDLLRQTVESYLDTVSIPHTLVIVDNASDDETREWILESGLETLLLDENRYPGYATNRGWEGHLGAHRLLHRADNDFAFLPGWCEEVDRLFTLEPRIGQVGLRTDDEELWARWNVGGNCVVRRSLWDEGLRYDERPWPEFPPGYSEDSFLSPAVEALGYYWIRVQRPCVVSLASGDWSDPYYAESYASRGIVPRPGDPTAPGTQ